MKVYDLYSSERGSSVPPSDIVIVGIDEESFFELNRPWPWPRSIHGRLISVLKEAGARAVFMDIIFSDPSSPAEDSVLAAAIRSSGNVLLAADVEIFRSEKITQSVLIKPIDELLDAGASYGISSIPLDRDNVVRRFYWGNADALSFEAAGLNMLHIGMVPDHRKMVHFISPEHKIPYVSYFQALQPEVFLPPDTFRNKIVLVGKRSGQTDGGTKTAETRTRLHLTPPSPVRGVDMFATPYYISTEKLTPGIEIHANMLISLMRKDFVTGLKNIESALFLVLLAAILTALNLQWTPVRSIGISVALLGMYVVGSYLLFKGIGLFLPFFAPIFAMLINFTASGVMSYVGIEKKRRYLRNVFSLYISPQVANKVLENPDRLKLGGDRVEATVLFTDLAGFTEFSETRDPEEVVSLLNSYATDMTRIIFNHGGTLDKFIGDAIMALWGTPAEDPDHAYHACVAAIEMQRKMHELSDKISVPGFRLSMRIGINTGSVMAGNMGSEERFNFTVIGDNVNLASRLEPLSKLYGTEIIISEFTKEKLDGRLNVRELDMVRVKGKKKAIRIFELLPGERTEFDMVYEEGLSLFRSSAFSAARGKFAAAEGLRPEDRASRLFIERCDMYISAPPEEGWDGVPD